jgi:hypothetical protein
MNQGSPALLECQISNYDNFNRFEVKKDLEKQPQILYGILKPSRKMAGGKCIRFTFGRRIST